MLCYTTDNSSNPTLNNVECRNNVGSGITITFNSNPNMSNIKCLNNSKRGIDIGSNCNAILTNIVASYNQAGGISLYESSASLNNITIEGNTIFETNGEGGGIRIEGGSPTLSNILVRENAISGSRSQGGGIYLWSEATLNDVTIIGNSVIGTNSKGGGVCGVGSAMPTLNNVIICDNSSSDVGGGVYFGTYSGMNLSNSLVARNNASRGGGFYVGQNGFTDIFNLTIVNNSSIERGGGILTDNYDVSITSSNIAYNQWGHYNGNNSIINELAGNWWGHSSGPYHPIQNPNGLGDSVNAFVDVTPWLTEADTAAPPIPVQNLAIDSTGTDFIALSWDANPIGDLAGYKIYFDTDSSGFPYANTIDVGNNISTTLSGLSTGLTYYVAATCYDTDGNESWYSDEVSAAPTALAVEESSDIPTSFALHTAYPNPFNPTTTIRFDLPESVDISIVVYDLMGREIERIVDAYMEPGYHQVIWDGRDARGREVPSGIYIARMVTPEFTQSVKMVLMR